MKGHSGVFVPDHSALPLVGDAYSGQVGGVEARDVQSGRDAHVHVALSKHILKLKSHGGNGSVREQGSAKGVQLKHRPPSRQPEGQSEEKIRG